MIEAFITNLGRYNEGHLDGAYLKFPCEKEDVQRLFESIHVDGVRYEEFFITDYRLTIPGMYDCLSEYENLDELNYLASLLGDMEPHELDVFSAAVRHGERLDSAKDLINLTHNLDCCELYPEVSDDDELGRYYIEECAAFEVPDHIAPYFDYEAYGRDIRLEDDGHFVGGNYLLISDGAFVERYSGREDIPDEYRVFAYPEPSRSIRDSLRHYQQMISEAPAKDRPAPAHDSR